MSVPRTVISTASLASTRWMKPRKRTSRSFHTVGLDRADVRDGVAEMNEQLEGARALRVSDARLGHDVNDRPGSVRGRARGLDRMDLDDRVDQDVDGDTLELFAGDFPFDQEPAAGLDGPGTRRARTRPPGQPGARRESPEGRARVRCGCARAYGLTTSRAQKVDTKINRGRSSSNVKLSKKKRLHSRRMRRIGACRVELGR